MPATVQIDDADLGGKVTITTKAGPFAGTLSLLVNAAGLLVPGTELEGLAAVIMPGEIQTISRSAFYLRSEDLTPLDFDKFAQEDIYNEFVQFEIYFTRSVGLRSFKKTIHVSPVHKSQIDFISSFYRNNFRFPGTNGVRFNDASVTMTLSTIRPLKFRV